MSHEPILIGRQSCGGSPAGSLSRGLDALTVPLSGGLAGGAEHVSDRGPGHAGFAGCGDRLGNAALRGGALGYCFADGVQRRRIADVCRFVLGEPTLQFVGMFEDLLQASGHGDHLKYNRERPGLREALAACRAGDTLAA